MLETSHNTIRTKDWIEAGSRRQGQYCKILNLLLTNQFQDERFHIFFCGFSEFVFFSESASVICCDKALSLKEKKNPNKTDKWGYAKREVMIFVQVTEQLFVLVHMHRGCSVWHEAGIVYGVYFCSRQTVKMN